MSEAQSPEPDFKIPAATQEQLERGEESSPSRLEVVGEIGHVAMETVALKAPDQPGIDVAGILSSEGEAEPTKVENLERSIELTPRELKVLGLEARGLTNDEIASVIDFSAETVKEDINSLKTKLETARRGPQLILNALRKSAITIPPDEVADLRKKKKLLESLTPRKRQVVDLLCDGVSGAQIAQFLNITNDSVKSHLAGTYSYLGIRSHDLALLIFVNEELPAEGAPTRTGYILPPKTIKPQKQPNGPTLPQPANLDHIKAKPNLKPEEIFADLGY